MSTQAWSVSADQKFAESEIGRRITVLKTEGSASQRRLSDLILQDPVFVATRGIEDLSAATGISAATISRYVKEIGVDGYAQFRAQVAEAVHELIVPVSKLGLRFSAPGPGPGAAGESLASAHAQMQLLTDAEMLRAISTACKLIADARQVWVMGFGLSAHLAAILSLGLQPYREGVHSVVDLGGTEAAAARLVAVSESDLLIAITFPRYSADVVPLTRYCKENGARVLGLTDARVAPIVPHCSELLLAPAAHPVLSSSSLPGLALIEALVSEFIISDVENIKRSEKLATALACFVSG
ncbi:MurR/RpiR family transcriptional regulator [Ruegeria profundi]|uniref:RpiR family transcriptional regulator n=1 Tax=Ruegeria profundi TaxID=1685378 RepID=A0A0X3U6T6_9RHOB|nr:MurR/RpiR family transcriptional regulator [Ruegeria profundi]KUJ81290.1 hypothetical protein AVO44_05395 [Ruegeria profundi]